MQTKNAHEKNNREGILHIRVLYVKLGIWN
jgi:hypothetical protein